MKILIVDSSVAVFERLREVISEHITPVEIFYASAKQDAIGIVDTQHPHVVILDINLPKKLSVELIKYLKQKSVKSFIVVLSIRNDGNIESQSKLIGADIFLDKFYAFENLPKVLQNLETAEIKKN